MIRPYYEIWKVSSDYSQLLHRYGFIEVNVKKKLMGIPTFYFTIPRDSETELTAPSVGDKIIIFRNYQEVLRGTVIRMDLRRDTIFFEGTSSADDWNFITETKFYWNSTTTLKAIIDELCMRIGGGWSAQSVGFVSKSINQYEYNFTPFYEELLALAERTDTEFLIDEANKKIIFQATVGTDKSNEIRFKRGVNLNDLVVRKEQDETWDKVICIGAGEGRNQLRSVRGTGKKVKVFTDKEIKNRTDLDAWADKKLREGNQPLYVYYEAEVDPPMFMFDIGDSVWIEDDLNRIDQAMRVMEYSLTFNETERIDVVFANKQKTLVDFFKKMEKGQRTLANVHHSSAVQKGTMIQVDDENNPILIEVNNDNLINTTTGRTIGQIETIASNAETTAYEAQNTADTALGKAEQILESRPNLVKNGYDSFEQIPKGTSLPGWDANGIKFIDDAYALDGRHSLKIVGNQTDANNFVYLGANSTDYHIPIREGKSYMASAYAFTDSPDPVEVRIVVRTSNGSWFYGTPMTIKDGDGWVKLVVKFIAPKGVTACILRADTRTADIPAWFDCFKLEEIDPNVEDPSPWAPASIVNIDATNITTGFLSFDRAKGGTLSLGGVANQNGRLLLYNASGETVADFDGASNIAAFDTVVAGQVISNSVASFNNLDKTIYVNYLTGDDEIPSDQNSSSTPYRSIARALLDIPRINDGNININVTSNGTEFVDLYGFHGYGSININLNGNTLSGHITVHSCTNTIRILNGTINYLGSSPGIIEVYKSSYTIIDNAKLYGRGNAGVGILVTDHSFCYILNSHIEGCQNHNILSQYMASTLIFDVTGKDATYGVTAHMGGIVAGRGTAPKGTSGDTRETDGGIIRVTFNHQAGTAITPPSTSDIISTWNSSSGESYRPSGWRNDNDVRQGEWSGNGIHRGLWFFGDAPSSAVTGRTIKRMRVFLTRKAAGGYSSAQTVYIRSHNYASQPTGEPSLSNEYATASFRWGESKWVTLPSSFFSSWQNGTRKGIGIYSASGAYMIFDDSAKLEITYA